MKNVIQLVSHQGEPRVDTRGISRRLGVSHKATYQLIKRYEEDFRQFGLLPFEMEAVKASESRGAKHHRFALLNEDQCYLLLTYSRNTDRVRSLKVALVHAFGDCRRNGAARALTYWQQLQAVDAEDRESKEKASLGAYAMLDRKRALPSLRERRRALEKQVSPDLFQIAA